MCRPMSRTAAVLAALSFSCALASKANHGRSRTALREAPLEPPKASLRASATWIEKIPDIDKNLKLAQQWMTVSSKLNATQINGTLVMVVGVRDAPQYYDCGLAMNTAWGAMARDPCSMKVWESSEKMKDMVPQCSKLRYGEKYTESYRSLKIDQDTWCGGPVCSPACAKGVQCIRAQEFPFGPHCDNPPQALTVETPKIPEDGSKAKQWQGAWWVFLCVILVFLCVAGAMIFRPHKQDAANTSSRPEPVPIVVPPISSGQTSPSGTGESFAEQRARAESVAPP